MAYIPSFQHDIFISYARVDNQSVSGVQGWVTLFEKYLQIAMDQRAGRLGRTDPRGATLQSREISRICQNLSLVLVFPLLYRYTDPSKFMWEINRRIALTNNKRMGVMGRLWGARFKNIVVELGENLPCVIAYIDANPQRAEIVDDACDFPNCSVGRAKEKLEQGERAWVPDIPLFNRLAEEIRAKTHRIDALCGSAKMPKRATPKPLCPSNSRAWAWKSTGIHPQDPCYVSCPQAGLVAGNLARKLPPVVRWRSVPCAPWEGGRRTIKEEKD